MLFSGQIEWASGASWHAVAHLHELHDSTSISRIRRYTMTLNNSLDAWAGPSRSVFQPGFLYLARNSEHKHQPKPQAVNV
ncbi:hypothetical protein [uncultured Ruegeria sp.]|uniref:hypothetical protein n=1 Tax=uncultured Ruegeria sp. TaxID=259304 RepID=UPI002621EBFF|nr:hypothetical protein [uncultured Ruegeria sp.]